METTIYKPDHDLFRVIGSARTKRIEFVITRGTVEHFQQLEFDEVVDFHSALGYWLQEASEWKQSTFSSSRTNSENQ